MLVSIVLPCRNEREGLPQCVKEIRRALDGKNYEIIVSDSSSDGSGDIAEMLGCKVVRHEKGYGNALMTGLDAGEGEYLVFADCDRSYDFSELPKFISLLEQGFDFVLGSRFSGEIMDGAMPLIHRYIGNPVLTFLFNMRFGAKFTDTHSGYRAITKKAYESMRLRKGGMEFATEMLAEATRLKLRFAEIPIRYSKRVGKSKLNAFDDGLKHLIFIMKPR